MDEYANRIKCVISTQAFVMAIFTYGYFNQQKEREGFMRQSKQVLLALGLSLFIALGCSKPINPISPTTNKILITQSSVVGKWTLSFQWQGRTPGVLTIVNLADQTAQMPGGQPGGPTTTVSGTTFVNGNEFTWVFPGDGSTWSGTAASGTIISGTMVNSAGNTGTWTAQESGPVITQSSVVGTWKISFQWPGRTPGLMTTIFYADTTLLVPGGQPGDNSTDTYGNWSVEGNQFTWIFPGPSTWSGIATSSTTVYGDMVSSSGTIGSFYAVKQ
jgi:hypothetical protein